MKNWYKGLESRFSKFDKEFQVLNIASDLQKAKNLQQQNAENAKNHLYRAIILLDYVIADPKWRGRLKELLRLREVIGGLICRTDSYGTLDMAIEAVIQLNCKAYRKLKSAHRIKNITEKN